MMRPDDIPEDVWAAAERPAFRVQLDVQAGQIWDIQPTIARAILAERDRCARIAADGAEDEPYGHAKARASLIAQAIRSGAA